jgi:Fur family ferric uptake transcriptional regulator
MARPSHIEPALAELFQRSDRHDWSIDGLTLALMQRRVKADFSSVYRALRRMVQEGSVSEVRLGDGKAHFEATGEHHEHVLCEGCGTVGAVSGCLIESVVPRVERSTGFTITGHRLVLSGLCPDCTAKAGV